MVEYNILIKYIYVDTDFLISVQWKYGTCILY